MTGEVIVGLLAVLSAAVTGYIAYKQNKVQVEAQKDSTVVEKMLERVDTLETRQDILYDKLMNMSKKADDDRKELVKAHEDRIEQVRSEMRKLIEDANLEIDIWRDRYFKLMEEYQALKAEHSSLEGKFITIEEEVIKLRSLFYKRRSTDVLDEPTV